MFSPKEHKNHFNDKYQHLRNNPDEMKKDLLYYVEDAERAIRSSNTKTINNMVKYENNESFNYTVRDFKIDDTFKTFILTHKETLPTIHNKDSVPIDILGFIETLILQKHITFSSYIQTDSWFNIHSNVISQFAYKSNDINESEFVYENINKQLNELHDRVVPHLIKLKNI